MPAVNRGASRDRSSSHVLLYIEEARRYSECSTCGRPIIGGCLRLRFRFGNESSDRLVHIDCMHLTRGLYCPELSFIGFEPVIGVGERRRTVAEIVQLPEENQRQMRRTLAPLQIPRLRGLTQRVSSRVNLLNDEVQEVQPINRSRMQVNRYFATRERIVFPRETPSIILDAPLENQGETVFLLYPYVYEYEPGMEEQTNRRGLNIPSTLRLPIIKATEGSCPICLEDFHSNEQVLVLPCFHIFHGPCILRWFKQSRECPVDKLDIEQAMNPE